MTINTIELARRLIKCPSVTPKDEGAIDTLIEVLEPLGFKCQKLQFEDVTNLYARYGNASPNFCFAGHTDVVPVGSGWTKDPFAAEIEKDILYGRGAVDMKTSIACFIFAAERFIKSNNFEGSISLLISGNEEGDPTNGTPKLLDWLVKQKENLDDCLVGEPTNHEYIGEIIKVGSRGSVNFDLRVEGIQGHVAYQEFAENPTKPLVSIIKDIQNLKLDQGTELFVPSNIEVTNIEIGEHAENVIPGQAICSFNIRFNDLHSAESLYKQIKKICSEHANKFDLKYNSSAKPFVCDKGKLCEALQKAIKDIVGREPNISTSGATSDARFIQSYCNAIEFGLITKQAHMADEHISLSDIEKLAKIYEVLLQKYFLD